MSIFIKNVLLYNKKTNVYIENNKINYIGDAQKKAETIINGEKKAILPTLVNGHTHAAMTLLRGYGDDMHLQEWLQNKIWPVEAKMTEEDVYWGTKLACLEMIKSGVTLFCDMYWHLHGNARAVEEIGIRALVSAVFIDFFDKEKAKEQQKENEKLFEQAKKYSSRIKFALGPHAIYTVSGESLKWLANFAKQNDIQVNIHLAETQHEVDECKKQHGVTPAEYLEKLGVFEADVLASHGIYLTDEDLDIVKKYNVNLIHNPTSNLKLASGNFFRYPEIKKRNISFFFFLDGCASNNNLDMFEELKFAALLQKYIYNDTTMFTCHEAWNTATKKAHKIFNVDAGEIKEGKLADVMLVDLNNIQMIPNHDIISNLVYSANNEIVDTVICNGKILMQNRKIDGEQEILNKVAKLSKEIVNRKS